VVSLFAINLTVLAQSRTLVEWKFDKTNDLKGWVANHDMGDVAIRNEVLSGRTIGDDPILELQAPFEISASSRQVIEVKVKSDHGGMAEFFWSNTSLGKYGGFTQEKTTDFQIIGDGQWHEYRVTPFWQAEGKIIRLRFDLFGGSHFAVESIRIVELPSVPEVKAPVFDFSRGAEGWLRVDGMASANSSGGLQLPMSNPGDLFLSPPMKVDTADNNYVTFCLSATQGKQMQLCFATDQAAGLHTLVFSIIPDGKIHTYNLDMLAAADWRGHVIAMGIQPLEMEGSPVVLRSIAVASEPQGPPILQATAFSLDTASPRVGIPAKIMALISNAGGGRVEHLQAKLVVPNGLRIVTAPKPNLLPAQLGVSEEVALSWIVECSGPVTGSASLVLSADNAETVTNQTEISFVPLPGIQKADYVPEPKPVRGKYDVGAYYFPGWHSRSQWQPIERFPERKPMLGWYREGDPEVADWHIKWAVEHGITYFAYDWYWCQGQRSLEHGLHNGYFKARYRNLLKFCLLWANHNPPKTHSLDDSVSVARYWITNYFQRPEYYRINDKPVVIIFSPYNYKNDMGVDGVNQAFEAMRAECRKAGLPGLYLVACVGNAHQVDGENYDAVTAYNWPGLGVSAGEKRVPYAALVPAYQQHWNQLLKEDTKAILLPLSGGWDSRPWHGESALVRSERNPELFKQHLLDARKMLDENSGNPRVLPSILIEAWNEWGEGSYIEPQKEFGFGYLDAVRSVFAADAVSEHQDFAPVDFGLGPYDLPESNPQKTKWTFERDSSDWNNTMDMGQVRVESGTLRAVTTGNDPAFFGPPMQARAGQYSHVCIQMRLTASSGVTNRDAGQLFWRTKRWPENEASSVRFPILVDGQWHDYELPVSENHRWTGIVTRLRLDPGDHKNVEVEIRSIELKPLSSASAKTSASFKITGDWQLEVTVPNGGSNIIANVTVAPPGIRVVETEKYDSLPLFNSNNPAGWSKGIPLKGVFAQECSTPGLLEPTSLVMRSGTNSDATVFEPCKDFGADPFWGTVGRLSQGRIAENQPVFISYRQGMLRIDSVVLTADQRILVRQGEPRSSVPLPPKAEPNEILLGNIWFPGSITKLTTNEIFPILETSYPEPEKISPTMAETLLPKTMAKIRQGQPVKILAWGDSVTDGSYLKHGRWQEQFVDRLRKRFPNVKFELVTEAWGGRNTMSYLGEPPGSVHNYQEKVLAQRPDLIVSEFVNDAGLDANQVEQRYSKLLGDFQAINAEWIILTPHYVRPDWMGLSKMRDCDEDPRPYVKELRKFAARHSVALADASLRYGRLWRQGIPYNALMVNSINHPDERGMKIFADALMEIFP